MTVLIIVVLLGGIGCFSVGASGYHCWSSPCVNGGMCRNYFNSFSCQCNAGFTGFRCQTGIPRNCATRHHPQNGSVSESNGEAEKLGSTLVYTCNQGYQFNDGSWNKSVTCTQFNETQGIWTPQPACSMVPNYCRGSLSVRNGHLVLGRGSSQPFSLGDQLLGRCNPGYQYMKGTKPERPITCVVAGQFEGIWKPTRTCQDIDECKSQPCTNGGTCRNRIGSFFCQCQFGYTGSRCQTKLPTTVITTTPTLQIVTGGADSDFGINLQCKSSGMRITIPYETVDPSLFSQPCMFGVRGQGEGTDRYILRHWGNPAGRLGWATGPLSGQCQCGARRDVRNSQWVLEFGFNRCGTRGPLRTSPSTSKLTYVNNVFSGKKSSGFSKYSTNIHTTAVPSLYLNFQAKCSFDDTIFTSSFGYVVNRIPSSAFNISGVGVFSVSSGFVSNMADPLVSQLATAGNIQDFTIGSRVTFEVSLATRSPLVIFPMDCWTSTGDVNHLPKFDIIRSGCPTISGVNISPTNWTTGAAFRTVHLAYDAFYFSGQADSTYYLHCTMRICTSPTERKFCQARCVDLVLQRQRRQEEDEAGDTVQVDEGNPIFSFSSQGFRVHTDTSSLTSTSSASMTSFSPALSVSTLCSHLLLPLLLKFLLVAL